MALVHMTDLLAHARREGYGVGAFDVVSLGFLEGVMAGAEEASAPVILSFAESHAGIADPVLLLPAMVAAARRSPVPVAIHWDHGTTVEAARQAVALGCNGVMIDASHLPFEDNVARTREVVALARATGVAVEGELGYVPGVEGEDAVRHPGEIRHTEPEEAARFVEATGVDCLAVSVGTVHGRFRGTPRLDFGRLDAIARAVPVPLVIHGASGLSDGDFRNLIARGVAKINDFTGLDEAAAGALRRESRWSAAERGVREAVAAEVRRCCEVFGAAGRADAARAACRPWREVEHLIIYNVEGIEEAEALRRMAEGRRVLGAIPGVRRAVTGRAVRADAKYRYCWLVRFCAEPVIASYRDHPDHVRYADERFRPVAGDRISIDYELLDD